MFQEKALGLPDGESEKLCQLLQGKVVIGIQEISLCQQRLIRSGPARNLFFGEIFGSWMEFGLHGGGVEIIAHQGDDALGQQSANLTEVTGLLFIPFLKQLLQKGKHGLPVLSEPEGTGQKDGTNGRRFMGRATLLGFQIDTVFK